MIGHPAPEWFVGWNPSHGKSIIAQSKSISKFLLAAFSNPVSKSLLIYWLCLTISISTVTRNSPGFNFQSQNLSWFPFQALFVWGTSLLTPRNCKRPVDILLVFLVIFLVIPSISISFNNSLVPANQVNALSLIYVFLVLAAIRLLDLQFDGTWRPRRASFLASTFSVYFFYIFFAALSLFLVLKYLQDFRLVNFDQIYSERAEIAKRLASDNLFSVYTLGWFSGILIPILFLISLYVKKYSLIFLSIFIGLFTYGITAQKWILASILFTLFLVLVGKYLEMFKYSTQTVVISFSGLVFSCISLSSVANIPNAADLIIRRSLIDPSIMLQYYVKFSLEYPLSWWSDSNVAKLLGINSQQTVSEIIGDRYFNVPERMFLQRAAEANATAGAIGNSIAQAGTLGVVLTSIALFFFFRILQDFSFEKNGIFVFVVCGLSAEILMEGALHTLLFSRGLIVVPIIFLLLPNIGRIRN